MAEHDTSASPDALRQSRLRFVPALLFLLLLLGGLMCAWMSIQAIPASEWPALSDPRKLIQGEATRRFTQQFNDHFILAKPFARAERALTWALVGDTGVAVRPGCPGWFFLGEELEVFNQGEQHARQRAEIVSALASRLQEKGIRLVLVLVPDKSRIEAAHLCNLYRAPVLADRLARWKEGVEEKRISVLDLTPVLQQMDGSRYYQTDSHWNEAGAQTAARALVGYLVQIGAMPAAPVADPAAIVTRMIDRSGDLLRVANLDTFPAWLRGPLDHTAQSTVAPPRAEPAADGDELFDETGLPTLALVGTSFSRTSNFVPFLSLHLGAPVANFAKDGGAFEGAAMTYLRSREYREQPPKVIVWEVPERMLQQPLRPAEQQWLYALQHGEIVSP